MRERLEIRCRVEPGMLPVYQTPLASGADLRANIQEPVRLAPGERALVSTGVWIELPEGYEAQVRPRSGLAATSGITLLNAPGTIDADYRGEIRVILINLGHDDHVVTRGMRVAQLVFSPVLRADLVVVTEISATGRGEGGFGSTGTQE
jgi:dUTP pyrophosphatase